MNRGTVDTWLERTILALVVGAIGFAVLAFGAVRTVDYQVISWLVLAAAAVWLVRIWVAPQFRFLFPPVCWAALPFVGYAAWRAHVADVEFVARMEFMQVAIGALLLLIVVNNLYSQESARVLAYAVITVATIAAMYGAYQWLSESNRVWALQRPAVYSGRASGPYICPNHLSGLLEMVLPLAIGVLTVGRASSLIRVFVGYGCVMMLVGIAGSQSRAGWMAAACGVLAIGSMLLKTRRQAWVGLSVVALIGILGYFAYGRIIAHRVHGTELTGHGREIRLRLWEAAWKMWQTSPWIGVGPDHFDLRYRAYRDAADRSQGRPGRAHNDYLNTLSDYGVVGLILALAPIGVAVWSVKRSWPHLQRSGGDFSSKKSNRAALVLGSAAGLAALLLHSFFDFNMHIPANALVAVVLLALIAMHIRFATDRYWFTARPPLALAATAMLAGVLAYLVPQMVTRSREVALLRRADELLDGSTEKIALLKRAAAVQPQNADTALAIGEQLRVTAFAGGENSESLAAEALTWLERAMTLNRWDPHSAIQRGMTLDWLGKHDEAAPFFRRAVELDPNFWYSRAMMGWHAFQVEDYKTAKEWMEKSLKVYWAAENTVAWTYLELSAKLLNDQQAKAAAGR